MSRGQSYKLVVGLGNPGEEYENTRHNAGFMAIDALMKILPGAFQKNNGHSSVFWKGRSRGGNIFLQKPMTFMNLSGKAVSKLMKFHKIQPNEVLLIFDDLDLPFGKIRIKNGGGTGGHNGVESVINEIGSSKFTRLRIGIGKKSGDGQTDHVLGEFDEKERESLPKLMNVVSEAAKLILYRGVGVAMNQYNGFELTDKN